MTCIESNLGIEAGHAFRRLLEKKVDCDNWRVHFGAAYQSLQQDLIEGEWDQIGFQHREDPLTLHDLCHIAEIWGEFLVPLPLIPAIAARRWWQSAIAEDRSALCTVLIAGQHGGSVVPYFRDQSPVLTKEGIANCRQLIGARVDDLDIAMPVAYITQSGIADGELTRGLYSLLAAEAIGSAGTTLRRAIAHASQRKAFGKTIVTFQAIRHRLADMYKDLEIARGSLAWSIEEPHYCKEATQFVFERCRSVVEGSIQVHGGLGFTWDAGLHFYLRHVMALSDVVAVTLPSGGAAFRSQS